MFFAIAHASEEWLKMLLVIMGVTIARVVIDNGQPPPPPPFAGLPFLLPITKALENDKQDE
jgi:hypothetical protein